MTEGATSPVPWPARLRGRYLADALSCVDCGYNLAGLPPDGPCPECGLPIAASLRGDLLRLASATYLATVHRGTAMAEAACHIVLLTFLALLPASVLGGGWWLVPFATMAIAALCTLAGWWLLAAREPSEAERQRRGFRPFIRPAIVIMSTSVAVGIGDTLALRLPPSVGMANGVAGALAALGAAVAVLLHLRRLALRLPARRLARSTAWTSAAMATTLALVSLGYVLPRPAAGLALMAALLTVVVAFSLYADVCITTRTALGQTRRLAAGHATDPAAPR